MWSLKLSQSLFSVFLVAALPMLVLGQLPGRFSLQINGQARYADSKTPVENALVRLESFSGGMTNQVVTDRTGKFTFSGLVGAQYVVTIHIPGYIDFREDVNLVTNNSWYVNALLVRDKSSIINASDNTRIAPGLLPIIDGNVPIEAQNEYTTGKQLLDQGKKEKISEAVKHLEKAVAIYPKFLSAQLMLGLAYMDSREWGKAEQPLRTAIEISPQASTAFFALGEVYRREKKYADAEKTLLDGLKIIETSAAAHSTLAKVYWEMAPSTKDEQQFRQNLENAWKEVSRSLILDPKLAEAHLLAGNLLLKARRADASLEHFEKYLELEPKGEFAAQTAEMVRKIKEALPKQKANN
jgi:Tfp pilus assembly protein PilF